MRYMLCRERETQHSRLLLVHARNRNNSFIVGFLVFTILIVACIKLLSMACKSIVLSHDKFNNSMYCEDASRDDESQEHGFCNAAIEGVVNGYDHRPKRESQQKPQ